MFCRLCWYLIMKTNLFFKHKWIGCRQTWNMIFTFHFFLFSSIEKKMSFKRFHFQSIYFMIYLFKIFDFHKNVIRRTSQYFRFFFSLGDGQSTSQTTTITTIEMSVPHSLAHCFLHNQSYRPSLDSKIHSTQNICVKRKIVFRGLEWYICMHFRFEENQNDEGDLRPTKKEKNMI